MENLEQLEKIWLKLLEEADNGNDGIFLRRIYPESELDLFLGIEKPHKNKLFILNVQNEATAFIKNFPESDGVLTRVINLPNSSDKKEAIVILLKNEEYFDVFCSFISDIIAKISDVNNDEDAVKILIKRLRKWQEFMDNNNPQGMSEESIRGLFGELYFMQQFLFKHLGVHNITAWKGFQNSNQDYILSSGLIEIKTTLGENPAEIRIASEYQLDKKNYPSLFLYHLSIVRSENEGLSLQNLIDNIKIQLSGKTELENYFESALFTLGYLKKHAEKYMTKFTIKNYSFYHVTEEFPKITKDDLAMGINDIEYSIQISECKKFIIGEDAVIQVIRGE